MSNQYYVQDSRAYHYEDNVNIIWWAKNSAGYTGDLTEAEVFTEEQAFELNSLRGTDIPWCKSDIDGVVKLDWQGTPFVPLENLAGIRMDDASMERINLMTE